MTIRTYTFKGKKYFQVQISYTTKDGQRKQPRWRFNDNGERFETKGAAKKFESAKKNYFQTVVEIK